MLSLEQSVEDVMLSNGLFSMPLSVFFFDWDRLNRLFGNVLLKYERYRPVIKKEPKYVDKFGITLSNAIQVKSLSFYSQYMIPSQCEPVKSNEYDFDMSTKRLTSIGSATYLVSYLAKYTRSKLAITEPLYTTLANENYFDIILSNVPDISTLVISKGESSFILSSRSNSECTFVSDDSIITFTYSNKTLNFALSNDNLSAEDIHISYNTKYEVINELELGDEIFQTFFGAELLSSLGNIKAICKFEGMPSDISADDLMSIGKELRDRVEQFKDDRSFWYEYLPS